MKSMILLTAVACRVEGASPAYGIRRRQRWMVALLISPVSYIILSCSCDAILISLPTCVKSVEHFQADHR
jgi:hypothetical protein